MKQVSHVASSLVKNWIDTQNTISVSLNNSHIISGGVRSSSRSTHNDKVMLIQRPEQHLSKFGKSYITHIRREPWESCQPEGTLDQVTTLDVLMVSEQLGGGLFNSTDPESSVVRNFGENVASISILEEVVIDVDSLLEPGNIEIDSVKTLCAVILKWEYARNIFRALISKSSDRSEEVAISEVSLVDIVPFRNTVRSIETLHSWVFPCSLVVVMSLLDIVFDMVEVVFWEISPKDHVANWEVSIDPLFTTIKDSIIVTNIIVESLNGSGAVMIHCALSLYI